MAPPAGRQVAEPGRKGWRQGAKAAQRTGAASVGDARCAAVHGHWRIPVDDGTAHLGVLAGAKCVFPAAGVALGFREARAYPVATASHGADPEAVSWLGPCAGVNGTSAEQAARALSGQALGVRQYVHLQATSLPQAHLTHSLGPVPAATASHARNGWWGRWGTHPRHCCTCRLHTSRPPRAAAAVPHRDR